MSRGNHLRVSKVLKSTKYCVNVPSRLKQRHTLSRVKVSYSIYNALASNLDIHPHVEDFIAAFGNEIPNVSAASPPAVVRRGKDRRDENGAEANDFGIYDTRGR